jgi:hypothetical protein
MFMTPSLSLTTLAAGLSNEQLTARLTAIAADVRRMERALDELYQDERESAELAEEAARRGVLVRFPIREGIVVRFPGERR